MVAVLPDGRTPTMTLVTSAGTLTLEDVRSAFPFAGINTTRTFTTRRTRDGASGAAKSFRIFDRVNGSEDSLSVTVPYMSDTDYMKLRSAIADDIPTVAVTYLHWSNVDCHLTSLTPVPDDWDWVNDKSYQVQFTLERDGSQ